MGRPRCPGVQKKCPIVQSLRGLGPGRTLAGMLLDKLLAAMTVDVEPFAVCEVRRGWSVSMPPAGHVNLHFNLAGRGGLRTVDGQSRPFGPNTLLVVPPGQPHRIELPDGGDDELDAAADCSVPVHGLKHLVAGADDAGGLVMVCGAIRATYAGTHGLFDGLKTPLAVDLDDDGAMRAVFQSLLHEQANPGPGSAAMMRALMTQALVAMLRRICAEADCRLPWLAALQDERIAKVLEEVTEHPESPHSLEALAKTAGMSRSAFSERFKELLGRPAMDLVRELRLRRGAALLRSTDDPVQTVAERVGFQSRSHFSRAFRAQFGVDPAGFRDGGG